MIFRLRRIHGPYLPVYVELYIEENNKSELNDILQLSNKQWEACVNGEMQIIVESAVDDGTATTKFLVTKAEGEK